jgi:hypothetical protein
VDSEDNAGEFTRAERGDDAAAWLDAVTESKWEFVGEEPVERDREGDIGVQRTGRDTSQYWK